MAQRSIPCGISLGVCRMRITLLGDTGCVSAEEDNSFVLGDLIQVDVNPNIETGTESTLIGGCGCKIASFKVPDIFNRFDLVVNTPIKSPALEALLVGGTVYNDNSTAPVPVGVVFPTALGCGEETPPVAVELWTQHWINDTQDNELPWIHWVFPFTLWQYASQTLQNDFAQPSFNGFTRSNNCWGDGPYGDGPEATYGTAVDIAAGTWFYTPTDPPEANCDLSTITPAS
jgi:hypothetical protein